MEFEINFLDSTKLILENAKRTFHYKDQKINYSVMKPEWIFRPAH